MADHPTAEEFEAAREKVRLGFQVYRPPPQLGQPSSLEQVRIRDSTAWQPYSLATIHLVLMNALVDMAYSLLDISGRSWYTHLSPQLGCTPFLQQGGVVLRGCPLFKACHTFVQELKKSEKSEGERPRAVPVHAADKTTSARQQAPDHASNASKRVQRSNAEAGRDSARASWTSKTPGKDLKSTDGYAILHFS